jgi:ribosome-binding protein aMBF1 (putative translation factor)
MKTTKIMKKKQVEIYKSGLIDEIYESISPLEEKKVEKKMLIAAKIEDAIQAKDWKHADLLKALGKKNPSIITRWLSGTHNFTLDTLIELEEVLEIELINLNETEKNTQIIAQTTREVNAPICVSKLSLKSEPVVIYTSQFGNKPKY